MTPHSLAFYVDVVTTGTVLGVGPEASHDRVTSALGPDFAENAFGAGSMFRAYGLAEFFWGRPSAQHPWSGHHFTLQVHRLAHRDRTLITELPVNAPYFRTFLQPDSRVAVSVIGTCGEYSTPDNLRVGDVYSIQAPMTAEEVARRRGRAS